MSLTHQQISQQEIATRVAANLRRELKAQRWSGRKAAVALGLPHAYVVRRISGETEMSASDLVVFADLLHLRVADFFKKLPDLDSNQEPIG